MRKIIVERTIIMHVTVELPGISQVFVGVVKIVEQHLTPIEKIIERLLRTTDFTVAVVENDKHLDVIGRSIGGEGCKQFTDGDHPWREKRLPGNLCQIFLKENTCTTVWKDKGLLIEFVTPHL